MEGIDLAERSGSEARDESEFLCPRCAVQPQFVIVLLDSCKGRTVRMFRCECGEIVWDD
jgi:hypothetical protein